MTVSVCIVGGGALGLSTAVHLVERCIRDVTVLEAEQLAAGSSGRSVGIVETQYVEPLDVEPRVYGMRFFSRLEREHGLQVHRIGYLRLGHSPEALEAFEASVRMQRELGVADARVLGPDEIKGLVPDMRVDDIAGGLFGPSDGYIDGHLYCALLARLAEAGGARVLVGRRLVEARRAPGGGHRLRTEHEDVRCDVVVNAAGPWAAVVGRLLGAEVPLLPQRHQAAVVDLGRPLGYVMPMVMEYTPRTGVEGLYFRHERADQLIAGLHTEEALHDLVDPDAYRQDPDPSFLEAVAERICSRLPTLCGAAMARGWAGIYPMSPDGLPEVGPHPADPSIVLVAGPGGSGIQLSPALGALAADWIAHGEPRTLSAGRALAAARPSLVQTQVSSGATEEP